MDISTSDDDGGPVAPIFKRGGSKVVIAVVAVLFMYVILSIRTVPPAHVALSVTLGRVSEQTLVSGVHMLNPLSSVVAMNLKVTCTLPPPKEGL